MVLLVRPQPASALPRALVVAPGLTALGNKLHSLVNHDGDRWSPEVRVTNRAANDWEPAVALDSVTSKNSTAP